MREKLNIFIGKAIFDVLTNYLCAEESIVQHVSDDFLARYNVDVYSKREIILLLYEHYVQRQQSSTIYTSSNFKEYFRVKCIISDNPS